MMRMAVFVPPVFSLAVDNFGTGETSVERFGALGILAVVIYYLFRMVLPGLIDKHDKQVAAQRELHRIDMEALRAQTSVDRKQDRDDFLQAISDQRSDFISALNSKILALDKITASVEALITVVTKHDTSMREAHAIETKTIVEQTLKALGQEPKLLEDK